MAASQGCSSGRSDVAGNYLVEFPPTGPENERLSIRTDTVTFDIGAGRTYRLTSPQWSIAIGAGEGYLGRLTLLSGTLSGVRSTVGYVDVMRTAINA